MTCLKNYNYKYLAEHNLKWNKQLKFIYMKSQYMFDSYN